MHLPHSLLALWLVSLYSPVWASLSGSFTDGGNTAVSAMMMFVGNSKKVYILDKAEGNAATVNSHPAWGAVWDMDSHQTQVMDIKTNVFCASGMHLPNGSYVTFGGNAAVTVGGNIGSQAYPWGGAASYDQTYQDYDGTKAIRVLNPCDDSDDFNSPQCQWFDDPALLSMQKSRWYSAAEPMADGTIAIIGGFVNGGYVNRNFPNVDPEFEGGAAESTFEFYPSNGQNATRMQFLVDTSGLNSYAHTFLMASGKMFLQANLSTMLWEPKTNIEHRLPDMPGGVVRVYPGSGAVAMLPLTPANSYQQTILFCGGNDMPADDWGNYSFPAVNTWNVPASKDCQRITPEPADGSSPAYEQDDDMLETRTMGQFIILPDGKMLVLNGGLNGTAGYATATNETPLYADMPFGMSLASGPVTTPALYDPTAAKGKRWSNAGLASSNIPRLYHSTAILLPDATVLVAGSNPNVDVNLTTFFPTEYRAEIFYPPYFAATTRPVPSGIPSTLSYGGESFDITIPAGSYSGSSNDAADSVIVSVIRTGWTTHAMSMGQRFLQLNNTYTVQSDGTIVLHVAQMPSNPNLFQPGPAFVYVTVNGIPSNGTYVIIGNGQMGEQPTSAASVLPASIRVDSAKGSADSSTTGDDSDSSGPTSSHLGLIIGAIAGVVGVLAIIGIIVGIVISRRRRRAAAHQQQNSMSQKKNSPPMIGIPQFNDSPVMGGYINSAGARDSSTILPLHDNMSRPGSASGTPSPYRDHVSPFSPHPHLNDDAHSAISRGSGTGMSVEYDPYTRERMSPTNLEQRGRF